MQSKESIFDKIFGREGLQGGRGEFSSISLCVEHDD